MPYLSNRFRVNASLEAVSFFHRDTQALVKLTPPPVRVQMQHIEPLGEGSISEFTLWFGPLPIHWKAVHSEVSPESGFRDRQVKGPMQSWVHTHHWQPVSAQETLMEERIEYSYPQGMRGLLARLLFAPPLLRLMLVYRQWVIRRECAKLSTSAGGKE
jgi:ligand-binding SRPBCC domain-containing protein